MRGHGLLVAGAAAVVLAGCTHLTAAEKGPRTDPVARLAQTTPSPWREDFGDPALAALLAQADAGSLDGKLALARLAKADAEVEQADAVRTINVVAGLSAALGGESFHDSRSAATPTLEVRNELDIWGRLAHGRQSARAERAAVAEDGDQARLQVAAETARSYFALAAAREMGAIAARRAAAAWDAEAVSARRLADGAANVREVSARRAASLAADAAGARAAAQADLELARLGDLAGGAVTVPTTAAGLSAPGLLRAPSPVSSTVVERRPDVRAAWSRIRAADERRAAAIAAARPQFQIAAAFGAPDAAIATLLDVRALAWAAAASLSHEILDGGARKARIHLATAEADLADLGYRQAVLAGWQEIRAALAEAADAERARAVAEAQASAARAALAAGETRYGAGALDGADLAALRLAAADADQGVCGARLRVSLARVALALAEGPA